MGDGLNIGHEELISLGNEIKTYSENFGELLAAIETNNETLKSAWQGLDAQSYADKVTEQAVVMNNLKTVLTELGQEMISIAEYYRGVMEGNVIAG